MNFRKSTCFCKGEQNLMYHGQRIYVGPATNDKHLIIRWELGTEKKEAGASIQTNILAWRGA